ncbi:MAG TPA: DUF485 domain-containing protein [Pseudonocardiaceae bacterium]|jgi:uncharacterized membrane protein (DUF485 family)
MPPLSGAIDPFFRETALTTLVSSPSFGDLDPQPASPPGEIDFLAVQRSAEFVALRRRLRRFVFPMSALFFSWYLCYVLLAAYAHGPMSHRLVGEITVGLVMGVLQFVSTAVIMVIYLWYARTRIDPLAAAIRGRVQAQR